MGNRQPSQQQRAGAAESSQKSSEALSSCSVNEDLRVEGDREQKTENRKEARKWIKVERPRQINAERPTRG